MTIIEKKKMRKFILLTEMHRLQTLLLEGRLDVLKTKFQDKLVAKLSSDMIPIDMKSLFMDDAGNVDGDKAFATFTNVDPDPTKKNLQWVLNTYIAGRMPIEDLEKIPDYIIKFNEKKKKRELPPEHMDLNRFKSHG